MNKSQHRSDSETKEQEAASNPKDKYKGSSIQMAMELGASSYHKSEDGEDVPTDCKSRCKHGIKKFFSKDNRRCGLYVAITVIVIIILLFASQVAYLQEL